MFKKKLFLTQQPLPVAINIEMALSSLTSFSRISLLVLAAGVMTACSSNDDGDAGNDDSGMTSEVENSSDSINPDGSDNPDGGDNPDNTETESGETEGGNGSETLAFVATRSADFGSGQIERISLDQGNIVTGSYPATGSDIVVNTDGESVYQVGRFGLDSITRFSAVDTSITDYQRSVSGGETAPNPYQIVFASSTKAYVIRYGSPNIWIVDPSATDDAAFKTGEISLGAYDSDQVPEANGGVIVDGKLFVLMERLENFGVVKNGYIAVIDIATDTEIDTGKGEADGLQGIPLSVANPTALQFSDQDGQLYVVGRGNFFAADASTGDRFSGGVQSIDPVTFDSSVVLDDGSEDSNNGFFTNLLVVSSQQAYLVTQAGFGDTTLRSINMMNGELGGVVANLQNLELTTLANAPDGNVWVGLGDAVAPGFTVLDPVQGSVVGEQVATTLIPINVVFVQTQ